MILCGSIVMRIRTRQPMLRKLGHPRANRTHPAGRRRARPFSAARDHIVDHALQAKPLAVLRRIDLLDAVTLEFGDFFRDDHPTAAAEYLDALAAACAQQIDQIAEVLVVTALVARHGDAVGVLVQRGGGDFIDGAVMAEVNHFDTARLKNAPHDVDRRIVAIEQRSRSDKAQSPARGQLVAADALRRGQIGHVSPRSLRVWVLHPV